mmetsp:Transcript_5890/g.12912  ORF Transcript_5890/g.12912 Transcript_5890/m.12912 type:complete len:94 (+) Transcript_5890:182-463(+)
MHVVVLAHIGEALSSRAHTELGPAPSTHRVYACAPLVGVITEIFMLVLRAEWSSLLDLVVNLMMLTSTCGCFAQSLTLAASFAWQIWNPALLH